MPAPLVDFEEVFMNRKSFQEAGDFSAPDFTTFCKKHGIQKNEEGLYPVFKIVHALNRDRKQSRGQKHGLDLEIELKKEKILKERIANQKSLKLLVSVDEAKARVRNGFLGITNILKYAIKSSAPRVALNNNVRECESILTKCYNGAIEEAKKNAKLQDWEELSANTELRRVELSEDTGEDIGFEGSGEDSVSAES